MRGKTMSQQYEIEFKNQLTKEQYIELLKEFEIKEKAIQRQINHYLDTEKWHLKNCSSALRIREKGNKIVCTLKEKTANHTHLETTDILTEEQRDAILAGNDFEAPSVKERLLQLNVPIKDLRAFGSITTDRIEIPYVGGTLVLDRSFYLHQEDYEVEYETNDVEVGNKEFLQFLQQRNIDFLPADNKIARFMKALMDGGK